MHIHAGAQGICPPASAARQHDGHYSINTGDGLRYFGAPQASLTEKGDTSTKSIVDFPRYSSVGDIRYRRTFVIPTSLADEIRTGDAVLVIHGIDYNHNGIYDGVLGVSDLDKSLPAEATAPALCGPLFSTQTASTASRGTTTYVVSLHPTSRGRQRGPRSGCCAISRATPRRPTDGPPRLRDQWDARSDAAEDRLSQPRRLSRQGWCR
jgi:hypothetical protein